LREISRKGAKAQSKGLENHFFTGMQAVKNASEIRFGIFDLIRKQGI
jgi:hypothetical protein